MKKFLFIILFVSFISNIFPQKTSEEYLIQKKNDDSNKTLQEIFYQPNVKILNFEMDWIFARGGLWRTTKTQYRSLHPRIRKVMSEKTIKYIIEFTFSGDDFNPIVSMDEKYLLIILKTIRSLKKDIKGQLEYNKTKKNKDKANIIENWATIDNQFRLGYYIKKNKETIWWCFSSLIYRYHEPTIVFEGSHRFEAGIIKLIERIELLKKEDLTS